jgi:hypothetical protein
VERDVGPAQQIVGIGIGTCRQGNADAGANKDLIVEQLEGLLQPVQQPCRNILSGSDIADIDQDQGELIAAEPGHGVDFADRLCQPGSGLAHELVTGRMA